MVQLAPWVFVLFWSTGFIVARYGTDDAGPLSFLAIRLAIAAVILAAVAAATGAPRPQRVQLGWAGVAGLGIHACYLGGVFLAYAWKLWRDYSDALAKKTFGYSIFYLAALFGALLVDHYV